MGTPVHVEPTAAILQCVTIAAGEVRYCSERVAELEASDAAKSTVATVVRPMRQKGQGEDPGRMVKEAHIGAPALNVWIQARHKAMDRLVDYSRIAIAAGVSERQIQLAERMGEQLSTIWERSVAAMEGLSEAQRLQGATAFAAAVAELERPAIDGTARDAAA